MHSLLDALQTLRPVAFRRFPRDFHSVAKQASFRIASRSDFSWYWSDFQKFWELNADAKIDVWIIFCDVFCECVLASIFRRFLGTPTLKNQQKPLFFSMVFVNFHKIDVFETYPKIWWCWLRFWKPKRWKSENKLCWKTFFFFEHRFSIAFFRIVAFWGRFWEAQDPPKIITNRKKTIPGRIRSSFQNSIRFGRQFWSNHWRFWIDFWTILKVCWKSFEETCSLRNGFCRTYFED